MSARTGAVISEQTFGETVADAFGVPFALAADGKWHRADASDPLLSLGDVALCIETSVAADGTGSLLKYGYIQRTGWTWTLGQPVYFGATPGTLTQTKPAGNTIRYAGYPAAADALWFAPTDPVLAEYLSLDLPTGTQGDLLYHNGTAWAVLNPDTAGKILQTGGPGANPAWADLPDGLYRNAIINGNFDIWQRGTSFENIGAGNVYLADRWVSRGSEPTTDVYRSTDVPGPGSNYSLELRCGNNAAYSNIEQRIEQSIAKTLGAVPLTVSFYVKVVQGTTGLLRLRTRHPSAVDNWSSYTEGQTIKDFVPPSEWQRVSATFTPNATEIERGFALNIVTRQDSETELILRIAQVQMNIGDKPLPFAPRPFGEELALCQRYYEKSYSYTQPPGHVTGITGYYATNLSSEGSPVDNARKHARAPFKVTKRVPPTMRWWDLSGNASKFSIQKGTVSNVTGDQYSGIFSNTEGWQANLYIDAETTFQSFEINWDADAEL